MANKSFGNAMIEYFEKTISPLQLTFSLIACIIMSTGCGSSDNEGPLELRPVENKEYKYSLVKMSVANWGYNGKPNSKYDTVALNFSMQKINNSDSPVIYKVSFTRFKWNSYVNYAKDSLHTKPITVYMNDSGTVVKVQGTDSLLIDIEKEGGQNVVAGLLPDYISENGIKDLFNGVFAVLPAKSVIENDTWVRNKVMLAKAPVYFSNLYQLQSLKDDTATIKIQANVSARQSAEEEPFLQGDQNGYVVLSYSTGMPFMFETHSDVVTSTNYYDLKVNEHLVVRRE